MPDLSDRIDTLGRYLDLDARRRTLAELETQRLAPGYWDDPDAARVTEQAVASETEWIESFDALVQRRDDIATYREMEAETGESLSQEIAAEEKPRSRKSSRRSNSAGCSPARTTPARPS